MSMPKTETSPTGLLARLRQAWEGLTGDALDRNADAACDALTEMSAEQRRLVDRLIAFSAQRVDDVLVPRADIIAVEASASLRDLMEMFTKARHSRLPVYRATLDDVLGMVHIKDLFMLLHQSGRGGPAGDQAATTPDMVLPGRLLATPVEHSGLLRPLLFAPPSMPSADLLLKMQATRLHMAIIVDEYGGTEGLATIEDLIEQIVGDIADEHDAEQEPLITRVSDGYVVSARLEVEELEKLLHIDLLPPERDEEPDTVGGMLFMLAGRVPVRGEIVRHPQGPEFEILDADPRRIKRVRVIAPPPPPAGEEEEAS